jgi:hypothetical protein
MPELVPPETPPGSPARPDDAPAPAPGGYAREWSLFADYCTATAQPALPTSLAALRGFFRQVPGKPATLRRRLRAIAAAHRAAGVLLYQPPQPGERDSGALLRDAGELIAACPTRGWPAGFTGRRDAFLVVLTTVLGHSHAAAREITAGHIDIGDGMIRIAGRAVPVSTDPRRCPRCAVARWLVVLDEADGLAPRTVHDELTLARPATASAEHAHAAPGTGRWRATGPLAPTIDRYGWRGGRPLSRRAIGTILTTTAARGPTPEPDSPTLPAPTGRPTIDDAAVSALLAKIEDDTAALDARIAAILADDRARNRP